ncbi:hypothetical protein CG709_20510, partial [Lachnotalea glycerini]
VTAIACFISETCEEEELPIICAMLAQLKETLQTMIAQQILCNDQGNLRLEKEVEEIELAKLSLFDENETSHVKNMKLDFETNQFKKDAES